MLLIEFIHQVALQCSARVHTDTYWLILALAVAGLADETKSVESLGRAHRKGKEWETCKASQVAVVTLLMKQKRFCNSV